MVYSKLIQVIGAADWMPPFLNYEIIKGNEAWRFIIVLIVILVTMAAGKICQFALNSYAERQEKKRGSGVFTIFLKCLTKPVSVASFALGLFICKIIMVFSKDAIPEQSIEAVQGINPMIEGYWSKTAQAVAAIAIAYSVFRLVDVVEFYLLRWTSKTKTKLDDMLVPVIRKSLRVTIAIIAALWIADGILDANIRAILLSAGVGGIAVALAAKDTIANFFGSVTIFADRPFQIDELVKIGEHYGPVEEVGFRSTKIRTLQGHLVTIPNSVVANSMIENVGKRPYIRRTSNITITYDSGHTKAQRSVEIIKEILAKIQEINTDPEKLPRVYFNEFNDWSLNIYMSYWVKPPDYWLSMEISETVNMEIMKRFTDEKIEFAFPSQTLYLKKE
ncbi:MAG: mechanosensitive ion channel family protein [Planctomycetota bacterium]|jgi:MscS family membrane protein